MRHTFYVIKYVEFCPVIIRAHQGCHLDDVNVISQSFCYTADFPMTFFIYISLKPPLFSVLSSVIVVHHNSVLIPIEVDMYMSFVVPSKERYPLQNFSILALIKRKKTSEGQTTSLPSPLSQRKEHLLLLVRLVCNNAYIKHLKSFQTV